jgi:hypothetical protein
MGQNHGFVLQLHFYYRARQQLDHNCLYRRHGRVKTHGPSAVTATQCSKWAESE